MLITDGKIITMNDMVLENGYIKTTRKTISEIGNMNDFTKNGSDVILDVHGCLVMPEIIDAHSHIGIMEGKKGTIGAACNEYTNPVTPSLRAIDAINPMDAAFHEAVAAIKATLRENPKVCYGDQNKYPSTRMANAALLRETLQKAKQYNPKEGYDADM